RFGNRYFDSVKPWALIKSDKEQCGKVMNSNLRIVKALAVMAWPFMPSSSERIWGYLGYEEGIEKSGMEAVLFELPVGRALPEPAPVYNKVEIEVSGEDENGGEAAAEGSSFTDFRGLDLRAGRIISAEDHPDAEKLFVLKIDIGEEAPRQIVAGLRAYYSKEQMAGRNIILVSNLKPAKLRGLTSQGMLLAADDEAMGGTSVQLLRPSKNVPPGTKMNSGLDNSSSMIEYKDFQKVRMIVSRVSDGKILCSSKKIELPEGAPERIALIVDGDSVMELSDGRGCTATVDNEIMDGASIR
ncbi:MAG: methionine--tRNA ligase, partial [Candidatus Methanoplasma sp.]|nr:methionine--tRNA ligase [Candidatus Methanoplasma sp.]